MAFITGASEKTADQPEGGVKVTYQVTLEGGELDGCTIDIVESLFGRDEGGWGIFDIAGNVTCDNGGFTYTSSGAWDGNGFHGSGHVDEGSGSGDFEGIAGRIAQLNAGVVVKEDSSVGRFIRARRRQSRELSKTQRRQGSGWSADASFQIAHIQI